MRSKKNNILFFNTNRQIMNNFLNGMKNFGKKHTSSKPKSAPKKASNSKKHKSAPKKASHTKKR
jgi:hypothetical protein